jgi:hypothetical protein
LVPGFEHVPYLLGCHHIKYVVVWGRTECEDQLEVGLLVILAPVKVSVGIHSWVRSGGSAVNHVL